MLRRHRTELRRIAARANRCRCGNVQLDGGSTLHTERILFIVFVDKLILVDTWQILWAGANVGIGLLETRLSADFRRSASGLATQISVGRLVKEQGILVEVVPRLVFSHAYFGAERPVGHLIVFDLVVKGIAGTGRALSSVGLRKVRAEVEFLLAVTGRIGHSVGWLR